MTTTTYEARAMKFARTLTALFSGCSTLDDFEFAIQWYNAHHSRKIRYAHGVSRIAIIRADYVIKFDMIPEGGFEDGRAGNCNSEEEVYSRACADGFEYLLAKTTVVTTEEHTFSIMPRVEHVNDLTRDWWDHCTEEEQDWLTENVNDLHCGNVGYRRGKVCVIDYAWDAESDW
jgi:hypothetical protein